MRWSYLSPAHAAAGALPPRALASGAALERSLPSSRRDFVRRWRLIEQGETAAPGDCPAVRGAAVYGWAVLAPGAVTITRGSERLNERRVEKGKAAFGLCRLAGDSWPDSDSGLVASWIGGAEYVKIQSGIIVRYARQQAVFQGPLPFGRVENRTLNSLVATGIERGKDRTGTCCCELNVIARLPNMGETVHIARGEAIGWFFLVPARQRVDPIESPSEVGNV